MRQVILYADNEDGGWIAEVPSLPGCLSQGETKGEAIANIRDAIKSWLTAAETAGRIVPEERFEAEIVRVLEEK